MTKLLSCLLVFSALIGIGFTFDDSLELKDTEGCSVQAGNAFIEYSLSNDFSHNRPKAGEVFRVKTYFRGTNPKITFYVDKKKSTKYIFGQYKDFNTFGIYESEMNFANQNYPLCTQIGVGTFAWGKYTEMDLFLRTNGVFTVVGYGINNGFALSCKLDQTFKKGDKIKMAFEMLKGSDSYEILPFHFDCPFDNSKVGNNGLMLVVGNTLLIFSVIFTTRYFCL